VGEVRRLGTARDVPDLDRAAAIFLASVANANTRKSHGAAVAVLLEVIGPGRPAAVLDTEEAADAIAAMFAARWGKLAPATQSARYDGLRAAAAYWRAQGWLTADPLRRITRPRKPEALDRAWSRERTEELLSRRSLPLREKLLYTMLYETSARVSEVLALDVPQLDRPNRRAPVRRKGGDADWIVWQTRTATLLPRYLKGRTRGPLILTGRRARVELPAADLDPGTGHARLSYDTAEELFRQYSYGGTLHELRHSSLTHAAEDGMNTPMLKRKSGHRSLTSLGRYSRPSVDALARWQDEHDPAARTRRAGGD
jgi:site-specific recombinase XerD